MNDVKTYMPHTQFTPSAETATIGNVATSMPRSIHSPSADTAAWLMPGLGCRYVGMGYDLIGRFSTADRIIATASSRLSYDIVEVCLEGSGRKHVPARQEAQVIYVLDCAYSAVLRESGLKPSVIAGHSLGNMAAGYAAGAYDFLTGLDLVTHAEDLMEALVDGNGQAMGVVIGLDRHAIDEFIESIPETFLANWNSPLQFVVGGTAAGVDRLLSRAVEQGAKQARRFVSDRAMHTPYMDEVAARFRRYLATIRWLEPTVPFMNSHNAQVLRSAAQISEFLGVFLSLPVYWQTTVQAIRQSWGSLFVEVGPGSLLTSMLPFIDSTATVRTASEVLDQKAVL